MYSRNVASGQPYTRQNLQGCARLLCLHMDVVGCFGGSGGGGPRRHGSERFAFILSSIVACKHAPAHESITEAHLVLLCIRRWSDLAASMRCCSTASTLMVV